MLIARMREKAPNDNGARGASTPPATAAIKTVFGDRAYRIPISGTKPYYAHALGASGAIEAAISCLSISHGWIPPTLNLQEPQDGCDLDYVPGTGRTVHPSAVLSNSFGFGGINACLAFVRPEAAVGHAAPASDRG